MSARPISVLIATPLGEGGMGGIDRIMDEVREIARRGPRRDVRISFGATRGHGSILFSPLYLVVFLARMLALKIMGRLDVLHINLSSHGSTRRKILVAGWARCLGVPYIIHLHGSRFRQFWNDSKPATASAIARMFSRAARIVVLGQVWKSFVAARVPDSCERITIIPNATPIPILPHVPDEKGNLRILFLGRVGARKGVPQLVEALSLIARTDGWQATIAGDGEIEQTRKEIERLGLADRVTLTGWVGRNEVAHLLSRADVLVLPSHDENLPMSVIEAMAAGLVVIATPVGAVEDIIAHGKTGLLVPVGEAQPIATTLLSLLGAPDTRRTLGENAKRKHRENLEIEQYFEKLAALWIATGKLNRRGYLHGL